MKFTKFVAVAAAATVAMGTMTACSEANDFYANLDSNYSEFINGDQEVDEDQISSIVDSAVDEEFGNQGDVNLTGDQVAYDGDLSELLNSLQVAEPGSMSDYDRDNFPHWSDIDTAYGWDAETVSHYGNCNAREVILFQQGEGVDLDPDTCDITPGHWVDGYGPEEEVIEKSRSVDIDHVVALGEAWRSGAADMDEDTRESLANDPMNLLASSPSYNRSKGDQNADDYIPSGPVKCDYVSRYVQVKAKYNLSVTQPEKDRLANEASNCG